MKFRILIVSLLIPCFIIATPKISIITSVYDGDQFIEGFLADITRQTIFDQCELILINANSPGNEEAIINNYLNQYPNIMYVILDQDPGLYAVWNIGIKMARGQYITNANLDDRLAPTCYEVHAQFLDTNPAIDFVYSDKFITYVPNETFENHTGVRWAPSPDASRQSMSACWPCSNPMWRKSMHDRYGFFNVDYKCSGDWEMWLRAIEGGAQFKKLAGYYLLYYHNPNGLSTGKIHKQKEAEDKKIVERYGYMWGAPTYYTYYVLARLLQMVGNDELALTYYAKAHELKPHRAEPLIRLAQHYVSIGEPVIAYSYASKTINLECPHSDEGFIERELYDYVRYDILGQTAWYAQEFEVGEQALLKALEVHPEYEHLKKNLQFYEQRKK
ncbi:MAG TPA: glycosyltransferase [Candidatus Babeliales bacterium]|nr:glycosyltransferase [Candidatus Babeliales bacterium]